MRTLVAACAIVAVLTLSVQAYSSAENTAQQQDEQQLGFLAFAKTGQLEALKAVEKPALADDLLAAAGIGSMHTYACEVNGKTVLFSRHTLRNGACIDKAWQKAMANPVLGPWFGAMGAFTEPHPRASETDGGWLPLEQVFYYRGAADREPGTETRRVASITGLKPEMEMQYRTLHQTTWPGVLAAIKKANIAHFSIYLFEIGEELYLTFYFDYVGDSFDADMAGIGEDPATRRWWKHTDPCQKPLPDAAAKGEIWSGMEEID